VRPSAYPERPGTNNMKHLMAIINLSVMLSVIILDAVLLNVMATLSEG